MADCRADSFLTDSSGVSFLLVLLFRGAIIMGPCGIGLVFRFSGSTLALAGFAVPCSDMIMLFRPRGLFHGLLRHLHGCQGHIQHARARWPLAFIFTGAFGACALPVLLFRGMVMISGRLDSGFSDSFGSDLVFRFSGTHGPSGRLSCRLALGVRMLGDGATLYLPLCGMVMLSCLVGSHFTDSLGTDLPTWLSGPPSSCWLLLAPWAPSSGTPSAWYTSSAPDASLYRDDSPQ